MYDFQRVPKKHACLKNEYCDDLKGKERSLANKGSV